MRILVVSTADWDHPFWTNKQHEAKALGELGHHVLYVEGLGLRDFSGAGSGDVSRIKARLAGFIRGVRTTELPNVSVVSPLVVPRWTNRYVRVINRIAVRVQQRLWRRLWGKWDVVWTFSPLTSSVFSIDGHLVYHCVDDISKQPGMPTALIDECEKDLTARADVVFTTTAALTRKLAGFARSEIVEHTNAVDFRAFSDASPDPSVKTLASGPIVGFVGALSNYKFDQKLVAEAAGLRPEYTFVLVGKVGEGAPGDQMDMLAELENVVFLGPVDRTRVPSVMAAFDVGLIPAPRNDYTDAMFPMKFFEYCAVGVPVVGTDIPALRLYADVCRIGTSVRDFVRQVDDALAADADERGKRVALAGRHDYKTRAQDMLAVYNATVR